MKDRKDAAASRSGQRGRIIAAIAAALVGLIGLAMLLYPTIADYLNAYNNKRIIAQYKKQVQQLQEQLGSVDGSRYLELVDDVIAYNSALYERSMYIGALTDEQRAEYEDTLNIMGTGVLGYIEIDKVKIALAIYHGTEEGVLHVGVGHIEGSSFPFIGENVHSILSAHSGLPSAKLFTNIDQLVLGDTFTIHVLNETLVYEVDDIQVILPNEVDKLRIEEGKNLCTLMTCTPYGVNSHRLLVTGHLVERPGEVTDENGNPVATAAPGTDADRQDTEKHLFNIPLPLIIPVVIIAGALLVVLLIRNLRKRS